MLQELARSTQWVKRTGMVTFWLRIVPQVKFKTA